MSPRHWADAASSEEQLRAVITHSVGTGVVSAAEHTFSIMNCSTAASCPVSERSSRDSNVIACVANINVISWANCRCKGVDRTEALLLPKSPPPTGAWLSFSHGRTSRVHCCSLLAEQMWETEVSRRSSPAL